MSRQLGLVIHGAGSRRQSTTSRVQTSQLSTMRLLSTTSCAADKNLAMGSSLGLATWSEEAAPSDTQGRFFEHRCYRPCARRAKRDNPSGCMPHGVAKTAWPIGLGAGDSCSSERAPVRASHLSAVIFTRHREPRATSLTRTCHGGAKRRPSSGRGRNSRRQSVMARFWAPPLPSKFPPGSACKTVSQDLRAMLPRQLFGVANCRVVKLRSATAPA